MDWHLISRQPRDGLDDLIPKLSLRNTKENFGESSFKESSFVSVNERAGRMSKGIIEVHA